MQSWPAPPVADVSITATATPMLEPDPIIAAIQRHKDAYHAHGAVLEAGRDDDTIAAASDADLDAREALLEVRPTTIAGAAALLRYGVGVLSAAE